MKKVVTVGIGGTSFVIDEDAYQKLDKYLSRFREKTGLGSETGDVMEDLEQRIAELFNESLGNKGEVVNIAVVNKVISQLGMPDGSPADDSFETGGYTAPESAGFPVSKRLYRNPDDKMIAGVCSGLAIYLNVDTTLVRVLFGIALLLGSMGFWAYIVFWIAAPVAYSAAQKCEMRGIPVTAENMKKVSMYK